MDRRKWRMLENICDDFSIKPIVAVVPENQDQKLQYEDADPAFWSKVRSWQAKEWTIAMHGYRHVLHHTKSKLVLPFYERSEFGGLPYEEQAKKVQLARDLFAGQGVEPNVWIAPAHSFDELTLKAIRNETTIRIVSDGIARDQYFENGLYWLPQQLWSFSERSSGLWTVCLHPNTMTDEQISSLRVAIEYQYRPVITAVNQLSLRARRKSVVDKLYGAYFWQRHRVLTLVHRARSSLRVN